MTGCRRSIRAALIWGRDLLRRSRVLVVCGSRVNEAVKNDIAVAQRLGITATTLDGILTVKGQGGADVHPGFEAYVTNMGKYNEGALVGEYLKFPTTMEEGCRHLKRIGIDGVRYEEFSSPALTVMCWGYTTT